MQDALEECGVEKLFQKLELTIGMGPQIADDPTVIETG